jgi:transcription antitermination protein NusB
MKESPEISDGTLEKHDEELTENILRGVAMRQKAIDALITDTLPPGWNMKKLDEVTVAILRAAIFEMLFGTGTPAKIVINEYMNLTSAFGLMRERNMVNGMMNALARNHNLIS